MRYKDWGIFPSQKASGASVWGEVSLADVRVRVSCKTLQLLAFTSVAGKRVRENFRFSACQPHQVSSPSGPAPGQGPTSMNGKQVNGELLYPFLSLHTPSNTLENRIMWAFSIIYLHVKAVADVLWIKLHLQARESDSKGFFSHFLPIGPFPSRRFWERQREKSLVRSRKCGWRLSCSRLLDWAFVSQNCAFFYLFLSNHMGISHHGCESPYSRISPKSQIEKVLNTVNRTVQPPGLYSWPQNVFVAGYTIFNIGCKSTLSHGHRKWNEEPCML